MSSAGHWDKWYAEHPEGFPCGTDDKAYKQAEFYLSGLSVEEWGCGMSPFKEMHQGNYVGVDGSPTQRADKVADLTTYLSKSEGILMRGVLEHNNDWHYILRNLCDSFTKTAVIIFFTPFMDKTQEIDFTELGVNVPVLSFSSKDIESEIQPPITKEWLPVLKTGTAYGEETILVLRKS